MNEPRIGSMDRSRTKAIKVPNPSLQHRRRVTLKGIDQYARLRGSYRVGARQAIQGASEWVAPPRCHKQVISLHLCSLYLLQACLENHDTTSGARQNKPKMHQWFKRTEQGDRPAPQPWFRNFQLQFPLGSPSAQYRLQRRLQLPASMRHVSHTDALLLFVMLMRRRDILYQQKLNIHPGTRLMMRPWSQSWAVAWSTC